MSTSKPKTSITHCGPDTFYVYIYDDWKQSIPRYMDAIAEAQRVFASICVSTACVDGLYDVLNVPTVKRVTITLEKDWDAKTLCQNINLALQLHEYLLQLGALP